jgi:hypothetical protein
MIAKVQPSKQKLRSSFKRLLNYLTKEVDPETGETLLRGEAVLSNNLAGIDTAAAEMKPSTSLQPLPTQTGRTTVRNPALRDERREQRLRERNALMAKYNQYRNRQREVRRAITANGREDRKCLLEVLRQQKKETHASALSWPGACRA